MDNAMGSDKKRIVIVGGGYAGLTFLERMAGRRDAELLLIDKNPYHFLQTEVYGYIAGTQGLSDVTLDLYTICASYDEGVSFLQKEVTRVDVEAKSLTLADNAKVPYDYLVLATGSEIFFPPAVEGLREHCQSIKSVPDALSLKQQFERNMLKMIRTEGICQLEKPMNIVVCGGGLSGVEIAAEMAHRARAFYRRYGYLCSKVDVTLVNSGKAVLKGAPSSLVKTATRRLEKVGVRILYGKRVAKVEEEAVELDDGSRLAMDFLVWTGGVTGRFLAATTGEEVNRKNQLAVDPYFRLARHPEVFVLGDAAQLYDPAGGGVLPPTAQAAVASGEYAAHNMKRILEGEEPEKRKIALKGTLSALGGRYGAGAVGRFPVRGLLAHLLKEGVFWAYRYPLLRRCLKGADRLYCNG